MRIPTIASATLLLVACNQTPPEPATTFVPSALPAASNTTAVTGAMPSGSASAHDPVAPTPAPAAPHSAATRPVIEIPAGAPPTTLQHTDLVVGTGPAAHTGQTVSVQYSGVAWSTHREFDSSWNRGQPFSFPLGAGRVIPGWDQGVAGMRVGGRRRLVIPPALGYGAAGAGGAIGPNETLVFVVDLVSIQ